MSSRSLSTPSIEAVAYGDEMRREMMLTAMTGEVLAEQLGLVSPDLSRHRILDVASGSSDLVAWLKSKGAKAIGLDPSYVDLNDLRERRTDGDDVHTESALESLMYAPSAHRKYKAEFRSVIAAFDRDMETNPSSYVAGDALRLPFRDNVFTKVVTQSFLSSDAGFDLAFTTESMREMLRVLQKGGELVVGTFLHNKYTEPHVNVRQSFETLKGEKAAQKIVRLGVRYRSDLHVLVIKK